MSDVPAPVPAETRAVERPTTGLTCPRCGGALSVPDGQALAKAIEIGQEICANGPLAVKAILRTLRETNGMRQTEALDHEFTYGWEVFGSNDAKEGPRAFKEKRTPNFTGT